MQQSTHGATHAADKSMSSPATPPPAGLPTPPTSHNEFRPPPLATSSRLAIDEPSVDASPTTTASEHMGSRRAAARLSGSSSSFDRANESLSSQRKQSRRPSFQEEHSPTRDRTVAFRSRHSRSRSRSTSSDRSQTPSPILGAAFADHPSAFNLNAGHLSFPMLGLGVGPTQQEIQLLVYGTASETAPLESTTEADSVDHMLQSLSSMGLDPPSESNASERERELAGMVKLLASRCQSLTESRDRALAQLHSTRLTALSIISSIKTAHAHAQSSEQGVHDRLDAEVQGWKAQAKMLRALLSRAEARGTEDSKLPLADRAKSATTVATSVNGHRIPSFRSDDSLHRYADLPPSSPLGPPPNGIEPSTPSKQQQQQHSITFAADAHPTTGLGISSPALPEMDVHSSPVSSLVSQRNKLLTDKKYLKSRVRDAEAQVLRLESELKSLRPYIVSSGIKVDTASASEVVPTDNAPGSTAPTTPSRSSSRKDKNRKKRIITMGDAETEHLMLAARRLREMRKEQAAAVAPPSQGPPAVHSLTSSPIKRQASEGPMTTADTDPERSGEPQTPPSKSAERPPKTPKSIPNTPRTGVRVRDLDGDERRDSWNSRHQRVDSASSFTGIDELLQAAQSLNPAAPSPTLRSRGPMPPYSQAPVEPIYYTREPMPRPYGYPPLAIPAQRNHDLDQYGGQLQSSPLRMAHESPKRRRVSSAAFDFEPYSSPFLNERQPRFRTHTEGANAYSTSQSQERTRSHGYMPSRTLDVGPGLGPAVSSQDMAGLSALDLLADQATASQNPSQDSDRSAGYGSPIGSLSSDDEMAVASQDRRKGSSGPRFASSRAGAGGRDLSPSRGAQPSASRAGAQAGGGDANGTGSSESRSGFGGNQNAEKRLPYVRWTSEEDSKLRSAIKEHGQRWELISRAVGTRSYHQCRQRYLLMRRKEAAAKAQAEADDGTVPHLSASASDPQSQESDYGPDSGPASTRRKSDSQRGRRDSRLDEPYARGQEGHADRGVPATPLHKLSIGAPAPVGSVYGQFSPDLQRPQQQGPLSSPSLGSQTTPTHSRSVSYPHHHQHHSVSPSHQHHPSSPYSLQHTPSATRRTPVQTHAYPPPNLTSAAAANVRHLAPLQSPVLAASDYASRHSLPPSSPHSNRHFSDGSSPIMPSSSHAANAHYQQPPHRPSGSHILQSHKHQPADSTSDRGPAQGTGTGESSARRMGAALYS